MDHDAQVRTAREAALKLRRQAEIIELGAIYAARRDGFTWEQIGGIYGLSRQDAMRRFSLPRLHGGDEILIEEGEDAYKRWLEGTT